MSGAVVAAPQATLNISCRDVSERKRAEAALHESERERRAAEERLREERDFIATVLDTADALIVVLDDAGRIVRWSGKCVRLSGYAEAEVRGRSITEFGLRREDFHNPQSAAVPWQTRGGEERWIVWRTAALCTAPHEPGYLVGAGIDVTEQRLLERQLRHAQRLEMLGTLVGGIAHDFNNHLTAIVGNLNLVLGSPDLVAPNGHAGTELTTLLRDAERAAQRCADMTKRLLTFGRGRPDPADERGATPDVWPLTPESSRETLQINALVEEAVRLLRRVLPATIQVDTDLQADAWPVRGDGTGLHQVLMNLAVNARDAMPSGGMLRLTTANRVLASEDRDAGPPGRPGEFLEVGVHDTGMGMSADVLQRIFDPFFTTKGPGRGTGLGLAVVYGIVKSHGGWVQVASEPGRGSSFRIFLPACPGVRVEAAPSRSVPQAAAPPTEEPTPASPQGLVLVVDDEDLVRNLARSVLERAGYQVIVAEDGEQALEVFRQHRDEVAVVLLDYTMPRMTGVQVFEAMRRLDPDVCVIFSTGFAGDWDSESLLSSGANGFVGKPYRPQELVQAIRSALAPAGTSS